MTAHQIYLPPKLIPVFDGPARVRGSWGGRGSAKTRSFATMAAVRGLIAVSAGQAGIILCAREYQNSLDDSSMAEVKAAIAADPWLSAGYEVGEKFIRTREGDVHFSFAGLRHNISSLKSKAKILLCWVDEAEPVTEQAWNTLIPSVREDGSEIWVTWNPLRRGSATDKRFKDSSDPDVKIIEMNWRDNPRFPNVLEQERQRDLRDRPEQYDHIWEGGYLTVQSGSYYARDIADAKAQGRICKLVPDPLMTIRLFCDIGGTGARADAFTIWAAQFVGHELRCLNYYESVGQPMSAHMDWLRSNGYNPGKAQVWLPHDGETQDKVFAVSYESAFKQAGYEVTIVPNQGRGAAKMRIEASRRRFPAISFDADKCAAGLDALGWYHEKIDENRGVGLGPNHDWASHGADSFGMMCVVYQAPEVKTTRPVFIQPMRNHMSI